MFAARLERPSRRGALHLVARVIPAFALTLLAVTPRASLATQRSWVNPAGGSAAVAGNWNPAGVPGPLDYLVYSLGGAYTVSIASPVDVVSYESVTGPNVGLSITGTHTVTNTFEVGLSGAAHATLSTGTLAADALILGLANGEHGALLVTGSMLAGYGHVEVARDMFAGEVAGAKGVLDITGGGSVTVNGVIQAASAGTCSLYVAGGGNLGAPHSALRTSGIGGSLTLGDHGTGWLDVSNNGLVDIGGRMELGVATLSQGTVSVYRTSNGLGTPSLTVRGPTYVGGNGSSATTGSGLLTVGPNANANFLGLCTVGSLQSGGLSTLNVTNGSNATFAGGVRIHSQTNGRFSLTGGSTRVTGGDFWWGGGVTFPLTGPGLPSLELLNGGPDTIRAGSVPAQAALLVGGGGQASMRVARPGTRLFVDGPVNLGADTQSGSLTIDSSATMQAMGVTHIGGNSGTCQLSVLGGAQWTGPSLELATNGGGGGVLAQGAGSSALVTGAVTTGPGSAWIRVRDGAFFTQRGTAPTLTVSGSSEVEVTGGATFSTTAQLSLIGIANVEEGTFEAGRLDVQSSGLLNTSAGLLRAPIWVASGGTFKAEGVNGVASHATAGSGAAADGFVCAGLLLVHRDTLSILDADGADLVGLVQLDTGAVVLPPGSRLQGGTGLYGHGGLFGELQNLGEIHPSDLALDLGGRLVSHGAVIAGGVLHLLPEGVLEATGTVSSLVSNGGTLHLGDALGQLLLTPPTSLGTNGVATNFTQLATGTLRLRIGPPGSSAHDTLRVSAGAQLGGRLELWTVPGYLPTPGDTFTVLTAGQVTGTFADVRINGGPAAGLVSLSYGTGSVRGVFQSNLLGVNDPPAPLTGVTALRFAVEGGTHSPVIALDLPEVAGIRVTLYDVAGREAAVLASGGLAAGRHRFAVAGTNVPSGLYFARAVVRTAGGTRVLTARLTRLR